MSKHKPANSRTPSQRGRPPSRGPDQGGGIWLWGRHAVLAALANPARRVLRLVAMAAAAADMESLLAPHGVLVVEREELQRLLPPGVVHQGLALLTRPLPEPALGDVLDGLETGDEAVVVVLDQATDPRNVGAVMRSAAAFGALAVVIQERHAPETTGTLAKAASGALERLPLIRETNLSRSLERLQKAGFWCVGLDARAGPTLAEVNPGGRVALVLGSEGEGLRRLVRETCDLLACLPIGDAVESLNVSNAAAVALYELARNRAGRP